MQALPPPQMSYFDQFLGRARMGVKRVINSAGDVEPISLELRNSLAHLETAFGTKMHVIAEAGQGYILPLYSRTLLFGFSSAY